MTIKCDLIVSGGSILTMDSGMNILEKQSIAIAGGRILDIYPQNQDIYEAEELIDASGCLVMPGLINTHSHIPMTFFRGLADDLSLDIWLNKYIWPLEAKLINQILSRRAISVPPR
jgi:5-methylthioadenosine/S-adenosylhomocysteine deaminase